MQKWKLIAPIFRIFAMSTTMVMHFNLHSREGSDKVLLTDRAIPTISIYTPAKGATMVEYIAMMSDVISIYTPAKGATFLRSPVLFHVK